MVAVGAAGLPRRSCGSWRRRWTTGSAPQGDTERLGRITVLRFQRLASQKSVFLDCKKDRILYDYAISRDRPQSSARRRGCALTSRRTEGDGESSSLESEKESLNFKISPQFKKEFKGFAVSEGISMTDLLKEGFALSKKKRQK